MSTVVDGKIIPENSIEEEMMEFIAAQCGLCDYCPHVTGRKKRRFAD